MVPEVNKAGHVCDNTVTGGTIDDIAGRLRVTGAWG
jgi:hypothetical protein